MEEEKIGVRPPVQETRQQLAEKFASFGPAYMQWVSSQMLAGGISYPRLRLIGALRMSDCPRIMSDLGMELGVTPRNVTKLVDALEEEGLVRRRAHPTDRRATIIELTPKGKEQSAAVFDKHIEAVGELFENLSEGDRRELIRLLDLLNSELRRKRIIP